MPLSAIMTAVFVGVVGYFIAEAALAPFVHAVHWLATVAAALAYVAGLIWHRARGFS